MVRTWSKVIESLIKIIFLQSTRNMLALAMHLAICTPEKEMVDGTASIANGKA